ncbi:uncharacterized protein LOC117647936 isoform X2 [Thrips palmi]|uniref:Uncharacterized protein LOC117647936 isoform X2 n=1 Tax=Thrips palmi TaxID=161013 RepID=A0A6P8Z6I0_THRPL|nr:uncharacterized protein LOC117647936 isoform X2 [Thrips palmi]
MAPFIGVVIQVTGDTWCVASDAGRDKLQSGLDWVCGPGGVDCGPIQPGASCFHPDTLEAHASYAFNKYFQSHGRADGTCHFGGAAMVVTHAPHICSGGPETPLPPQVTGDTWCVASDAGRDKLQSGLDWVCGPGGVDCGPIQPGASCFHPDTLEAHASYAFNKYYLDHGRAEGTCSFDGAAKVVTHAPHICSGGPETPLPPQVSGDTWCVASDAGRDKLQSGLDWVCGPGGVDCGPIQPGASCFHPDTLEAHASYAFNKYFQSHGRADGTCSFNGAAKVVTHAPHICAGGPETPLPPQVSGDTWCVASDAGRDKLQSGLDWVCGPGGVDCGPIQPGASCFHPDTLEAHASYAFNKYYLDHGRAEGTCSFNGAATVVTHAPLIIRQCRRWCCRSVDSLCKCGENSVEVAQEVPSQKEVPSQEEVLPEDCEAPEESESQEEGIPSWMCLISPRLCILNGLAQPI